MKKILKEYEKQIEYFIKNKKYIFCIIIVALLSYGFTITHYSIGIDDLCFDRYVDENYILVAKRWGTWLLYNFLNIHSFTPFWIDLITTLNIMFLSILICSFLKRNLNNRINDFSYIVFSCIMISSPIIFHFYIYQTTSLSVSFSAIIVVVIQILIYENFFKNNNNIYLNFLFGILMSIPISMYESCIQIFLVMCGVSIFVSTLIFKAKIKQILKYLFLNFGILLLGFVIYYLIGSIIILYLKKINKAVVNFAYEIIPWKYKVYRESSLHQKKSFFIERTRKANSFSYLKDPTLFFNFLILIIVYLKEIYNLIKKKNVIRFLSVMMIIISNLLLIILQGLVLYRTELSFVITIAFAWLYLFQMAFVTKYFRNIFIILTILFTLFQTQVISKMFYTEYKKFEQEKNIATNIGFDVMKNFDYKNKPLLYTGVDNESDNGFVLKFGIYAFNEVGVETTKFINNFGFNFKYVEPTKSKIKEALNELDTLTEEQKENNIVETDKFIIINLSKYGIK